MKSFVCVCLLLGLLSEPQAQTAEQAKAQAQRTTEIAAVMSVLAQDSFGSIGYPKLFETCTQTIPPAELFDDRKDFGRAYLPVLQHVKKLQISIDSEADRWFAECLTRLMKASGPRGRYFSLEEVKRLSTGYLKTIGLIVTRLEGNWIVREAIPGSPAAEVGVKTGDVLLSVSGIELGGLTNVELSDALEFVPEGETSVVWQPRDTSRVERRMVKSAPLSQAEVVVVARMPDHLYMRIGQFSKNTKPQLLEALRAARIDSGIPKVLDLRGNPGGLLQTAHWLAELFAQKPKRIDWVPVKYPRGSEWEHMSFKKHLYAYSLAAPRIPEASANGTTVWFEGGRWLVLVDGETSSGAAWLAGVLKELNRAMLLGSTADSTSMSVFTIRPIGPSKEVSAIRYETGRLVLPSGNFLAAGELAPDVSIRPKQLVKPFPKSGVDWSSDPFYETVQSKLRQ